LTDRVACSNISAVDSVCLPADEWSPQDPADLQSQPENVIYFIRRAGVVKIGTTRNLRQRFLGFGEFEFLGAMPGGFGTEFRIHKRFEHLAIPKGRELFMASPDLLAFIDEHRTIDALPAQPPWRRRPAPPESWWRARVRQGSV